MTGSQGWHPDPSTRHQLRFWDGSQWTEHVSDAGVMSVDPLPGGGVTTAYAGQGTAGPGTKNRANPVLAILAAIGAFLLVIGSFLDRVTLFGTSLSYIGDGGDGAFTLVIGGGALVVAVLVAVGTMPRWGGFLVLGLGALGALIALIDMIDILDATSGYSSSSIELGPATPVCLAGGLIAALFGLLAAVIKPPQPRY